MTEHIDLPDIIPPAPTPALVRRDRTSQPDVYRHYDLEKSERTEPAIEGVVSAVEDA